MKIETANGGYVEVKDKDMPKINQTVYVIYGDCIFVEKVYSLGEKSFIVASFKRNTKEDYWEWQYKDKGVSWFTDLEEAKEKLMSRYTDDYELVQYDATWYEVSKL